MKHNIDTIRRSLSLRGLRTNAPPVVSPAPNRKKELLVAPKPLPIRSIPYVSQLINPNGSENFMKLRSRYLIPVKSDGFNSWIQQQKLYISSLSIRDTDILTSYTHFGDTILNNYIRGTLHELSSIIEDVIDESFSYLNFLGYFLYDQYDDFSSKMNLPLRITLLDYNQMDDDDELVLDKDVILKIISDNSNFLEKPLNIAPLLEQYKQELTRIILSAPRLPGSIIVYRGFTSEEHITGLEYSNNDFVSTSLSPSSALGFANFHEAQSRVIENVSEKTRTRYAGGLYEIEINQHIPCVYMEFITYHNSEYEVLLPPGIQFTFDSKIHFKLFKTDDAPNGYKDETKVATISTSTKPIHPFPIVPYIPRTIQLPVLTKRFINSFVEGDVLKMKAVLKDGVDPSIGDNYAIRNASAEGHTEIVRLLLQDPRVDPTARDNMALRLAILNNHLDIVKLLRARRNVSISDPYRHRIPTENKNGSPIMTRRKPRKSGLRKTRSIPNTTANINFGDKLIPGRIYSVFVTGKYTFDGKFIKLASIHDKLISEPNSESNSESNSNSKSNTYSISELKFITNPVFIFDINPNGAPQYRTIQADDPDNYFVESK